MAVIAIGGGKGGVGRSLVATGIAVVLAQLGKRVLLVDGHPFAPSLAGSMGIARSDGLSPPWLPTPSDALGSATMVPGLRLVSASTELGAVRTVPLRRPREIARAGTADHTVFDLGMGIATSIIDAMLDAETTVLVSTPEPAAIEAIYRFIRHAYARVLQARLVAHPPARAAVRRIVRDASGPPHPVQLAGQLALEVPTAAETAWESLERMRFRLVVNATRSRADLDLGESLAIVARQQLGIALEYLGHVEYDDTVVLAARRRRPLLVDVPGAKASRNIERLARRIVALDGGRGDRATHPADAHQPRGASTHYDALAIEHGSSDEEIRRAYRRMREIHAAESLAIAGVFTEAAVNATLARIDEARDVLLDPARRRPYDLSITTVELLEGVACSDVGSQGGVEGGVPTPLPDLSADTEYSGALLRQVREARGIELRDVAARTKISLTSLRAIESDDFDALPATVYLRGFLAEIARCLHVDVEQTTRTYLRRRRRAPDA